MSTTEFHSDSISSSPSPPPSSVSGGDLTESGQPTFLERFLDSFFQERNIKWMLIVGAAIVFGSSLMLVTKAWSQWTPALKYLVIVGYTAAIFLSAEVTRVRLRLDATYKVLQSLTLLLLPICFLSLTWVSPGSAWQSLEQSFLHLVLLIPAVALLIRASTRILDHWLHVRQTTFLISFWLLSVAGAIPKIASPMLSMIFVLLCWIVFTAGVLKINRHTFWLSETHRVPRVLGFLPIIMLGLQFVVLVGTKAAMSLPAAWLGFAAVLVSGTVLATARTVAEVYRQRSGDLVRPLPWPIVLPLFTGLALTLLGTAFSMVGFSYVGPTTYAIVPTAILAAAIFGMVARDTKHRAFAWVCLILIAIAYQCSPTLLSSLVETARATAADVINQERIPISLYGLTYLPLLLGLTIVRGFIRDEKSRVFATPIKHFVTLIAVALFAFSVTNLTSLFWVSIGHFFLFTLFGIVFGDRRYVLGSILALVGLVAVTIPAGNQMSYWTVSLSWIPLALSGLATAMTISRWPDHLLRKLPLVGVAQRFDGPWIQIAGYGLAVMIGCHWLAAAALSLPAPLSLASLYQLGFVFASILLFTLRVPRYPVAIGFWAFSAAVGLRFAVGFDFHWDELLVSASYLMMVGSVVASLVVRSHPILCDRRVLHVRTSGLNSRIMTLGFALMDLSSIGLVAVTFAFFVPTWVLQHVSGLIGREVIHPGIGLSSGLLVAWWLLASWRSNLAAVGRIAGVLLPIATTATIFALGWHPGATEVFLFWSIIQGIAAVVYRSLCPPMVDAQEATANQPVAVAMWKTTRLSLLVLGALSCVSFDWPMRGVVMIAAASTLTGLRNSLEIKRLADLAILANLQVLLAVAALAGCTGWVPTGLIEDFSSELIAGLLATCSVSVLLLDHVVIWAKHAKTESNKEFAEAITTKGMRDWITILRGLSLSLIGSCFVVSSFTLPQMLMITVAVLTLAIAELRRATVEQSETRVWYAGLLTLVAVGFLYREGVISLGMGVSQFVLLGLGVIALGVHHFANQRSSMFVFARPTRWMGDFMPAMVATLAVIREFTSVLSSSTPLGSLALMLAAGIYFHRAMVTGKRSFVIAAVAIANAGVFLLWRSLGWGALELYLVPIGLSLLGLVEAMKDRLPENSHNPIRYIAVFTMMGSPLFEVLGGSWLHMFAVMVLSVIVILVAIGLRLRTLVLAGCACLTFDLVAMVVRSTIHNMTVLWIGGVVLGIAVIALAAFCENHREKLLSRIRILSAELATWN